ncbi:MAG: heavy-metal-associated domain-containing protein, partial [Allorhizobium sp.]
MCSCQQHSNSASETVATLSADGLSFRVDDMTCGHCASTIKKAIEATLPGTTVDADLASKLVNVKGFGDYAAIKAIVTGAGYTPSAAPVAA